MTPDERQLLSGLFDRIRNASSQPRDREAEAFISDAVRQQPYASYLLAQTVIVQEQALRAANDKLQELENKVRSFESGQGGNAAQEGGFLGGLGGLGRSIFGGGQNDGGGRPPANVGPQGGFGQGGAPGGGFGGAPQGGPWGQGGQAQGGGGGFLKGALGMAAGVAGGALLGNAVSGLFHGGNNPFGIGSGMSGLGGGGYPGGGETIVNNYYEGEPGGGGGYENAADYGDDSGSGDGGGFDSDDGYNV